MAKRKPKKVDFVDEVKRFSEHEGIKIGDWIVYKRVSDDKMSVGEVRWFSKCSEGMSVTVIDKNFGNFQLGVCRDIEVDASPDRIKKLLEVKRKVSK